MKFEVLKQSHLKRNILIGVVVVLILIALILTFTRAKYRVTESIPLVNGTINYSLADLNIVAITVDGEASDTIPEGNYKLTEESYCTVNDEEDSSITLNYDSSTQTLSVIPFTTKGTKCYLDFEKLKSAADTIEELYPNNQDILAYDDYNNLRYISANPDNYVYFNCDDYNNLNSSSCELWRIIGVFNEDTHGINGTKLVKLVRNDSLGNIAWDIYDGNNYTNNWETANLQKDLNDNYLLGNTIENEKGITPTTREMISTITWKLGGTTINNDSEEETSRTFYTIERSETVFNDNPTTWIGKIALIYPSDYGYATSGENTTSREICLITALFNWNSADFSDCKNNDWLYNGDEKWTITPGSQSYLAFHVDNDGHIYASSDGLGELRDVYPTVYLSSSVAITGGEGTEQNPYTLAPN